MDEKLVSLSKITRIRGSGWQPEWNFVCAGKESMSQHELSPCCGWIIAQASSPRFRVYSRKNARSMEIQLHALQGR